MIRRISVLRPWFRLCRLIGQHVVYVTAHRVPLPGDLRQFACFVQAGGYREDAYWPDSAQEWRNGQIRQEGTLKAMRKYRKMILDWLGPEASAENIRDFFHLSLLIAKCWQDTGRSWELAPGFAHSGFARGIETQRL